MNSEEMACRNVVVNINNPYYKVVKATDFDNGIERKTLLLAML